MIDTKRENEIRLGTEYNFGSLGYAECNLNDFYVSQIGVRKGDVMILDMFNQELFNIMIMKYNEYARLNSEETVPLLEGFVQVKLPCKVSNLLEGSYGKFPHDGSDQTLIMEYD